MLPARSISRRSSKAPKAPEAPKAKENNVLVGTIIWSAFGIATLYLAGMMPVHKIMPNFTVDDYYRWWVVHLWVELTFELFAAGVLAFLTVALGLVPRKMAERIMLFELGLIMMSGVLGVGHHYWWQGLDEYWIAVGGIFSALELLPLVLLMIEAFKQQRKIYAEGKSFPFAVPFLFLAGSAFWNWSQLLPDGLMILGALVIFLDLVKKSLFARKTA